MPGDMCLPLWCGSIPTSPSTITQDHSTVIYLVCKPGESPFHLTSHLVCSHSRIVLQGSAQISHHSCSPAWTGPRAQRNRLQGCMLQLDEVKIYITASATPVLAGRGEPWHIHHPLCSLQGQIQCSTRHVSHMQPICCHQSSVWSLLGRWCLSKPPLSPTGPSSVPCHGRGYSSSTPTSPLVPRWQCKAMRE